MDVTTAKATKSGRGHPQAAECRRQGGDGKDHRPSVSGVEGQRGNPSSLAEPYGGIKAEKAKRLKKLEEENKRLKRLLADAELDAAILREALEGN